MKTFRTLNLAIEFYQHAKSLKLPNKHLQDQFDRALISVVLNLGEGSAKPTAKDRRKFYHISLGSFREVQTLLLLHSKTFRSERLAFSLMKGSGSLGAHLYKLCKNT